MKVNLQPLEDTEKSERGKTIVYLAGASALLFEAFKSSGESVGRFQIPSGGQVTLRDTFDKLRIKNMGGVYTESEILIVEGDYARISDVSIVQIQGITNTISAQITNQIDAAIVSLPAVEIDSLPSVDVSNLPEVVQKDVGNVLTTSYTVNAESVITIPAKAGRKRAVVQGYVDSINTTICRISDSAKAAITGEFFAVGGGLLAESEHTHSAALKVWNPSITDNIEIVVREEF